MQNDPLASAYGPAALKVMGEAFDKAWALVAPAIPEGDVALAREMLADAIISVASDDCHDAERLKQLALTVMATGEGHPRRMGQ
jgi:hypothetical protein